MCGMCVRFACAVGVILNFHDTRVNPENSFGVRVIKASVQEKSGS